MSIDRPRRIFRGSRRGAASLAAATAVLGAVILGAAAMIGIDPLPQPPAAGGVPRLISAAPGQVAVIDGDTLRLGAEVVRLGDIAAPQRGQACAAGPDCGGRATAALASMVRDQPVECRVSASDGLGRAAGQCAAGGRDLNIALVADGWARAELPGTLPGLSPALVQAETDARTHRRGIWLVH